VNSLEIGRIMQILESDEHIDNLVLILSAKPAGMPTSGRSKPAFVAGGSQARDKEAGDGAGLFLARRR